MITFICSCKSVINLNQIVILLLFQQILFSSTELTLHLPLLHVIPDLVWDRNAVVGIFSPFCRRGIFFSIDEKKQPERQRKYTNRQKHQLSKYKIQAALPSLLQLNKTCIALVEPCECQYLLPSRYTTSAPSLSLANHTDLLKFYRLALRYAKKAVPSYLAMAVR